MNIPEDDTDRVGLVACAEHPPMRVATALEYLVCMTRSVSPQTSDIYDQKERETRYAALDCLRMYFNGEMDYPEQEG